MILTQSVRSVTSLIERGDFHSAVEVLGDRWPGIGLEPDRNGESDVEYARLMLVCGILSIELGRWGSVPAQSAAKDLLSRAGRLFRDAGEQESRSWLAVAYLRCGENNEALSLADSILTEQTADSDVVFRAGRVKALALLNLGNLDGAEGAFASVEVFIETVSPLARGRFYLSRGILFRQTGQYEAALSDYNAAGIAFREAECVRYAAAVENNRAGVYMEQGRLPEARNACQCAIALFRELGDRAHEAKAWDQLAQVFRHEGSFVLMETASREAVTLLSEGDHEGWLAEALTTHGIACAHMGLVRAQSEMTRALEICDRQGDPKQADLITASMWMVVSDGRRVVDETRSAVEGIERTVYERLLKKHGGRVSVAARTLGLSHQAFQRRLKNHFPELLSKRHAPRCRRWSKRPHATRES